MRWSRLAIALGAAVGILSPSAATVAFLVRPSSQDIPFAKAFSALANRGVDTGPAAVPVAKPGASGPSALPGNGASLGGSAGFAFTESSLQYALGVPSSGARGLGGSVFAAGGGFPSNGAGLGSFSGLRFADRGASGGSAGGISAFMLGGGQFAGQQVSPLYLGFNDRVADAAIDAAFDSSPAIRPLAVPSDIAAVPEPGTWALLLLGFGALGVFLRAERRKTAVPQA